MSGRLLLKCDGTRAETRFRLSAKRTSPFKSAGASVQSSTGSRGVRISGSNAGYTMFQRSCEGLALTSPTGGGRSVGIVRVRTKAKEFSLVWRVLATHSIRELPLHFPSRAPPSVITFQLDFTYVVDGRVGVQMWRVVANYLNMSHLRWF